MPSSLRIQQSLWSTPWTPQRWLDANYYTGVKGSYSVAKRDVILTGESSLNVSTCGITQYFCKQVSQPTVCRPVGWLTGPAGWWWVAGIVDPSILSNAWVAFREESESSCTNFRSPGSNVQWDRTIPLDWFFFYNVVQSCCFMVAAECWLRRWCGLVHKGLRYGKRRNMCLYSTENTLIYSLRITVS